LGECRGVEPGCSGGAGRAKEKFAAFQLGLLRNVLSDDGTPIYGRMAAGGGYQTRRGFIELPRPLIEGRERSIDFAALWEAGFQ
jgi:hypothetical protein